MNNSFDAVIKNSREAIKNWWILLIAGIALFVAGIITFIYPESSYLSLAVVFGWLILFSGVAQIIIATTNRHFVTGRGWMLFGGIIETIIGVILILSLTFSAATLPVFLGFWLLFKGFNMIGFGSDLRSMSVAGSVWTIFTAILLIIVSIVILAQPILFGVEAVIIWVGISLLFAGLSVSAFALQLRNAHKI